MKAITVKFHGHTAKKPARYIASDSDGNRYTSHESDAEAALGLCNKMMWTGQLVRGSTKNAEVYVFLGGPVYVAMPEAVKTEHRKDICISCGLEIENVFPFDKDQWRDRGNNNTCDMERKHVPRDGWRHQS